MPNSVQILHENILHEIQFLYRGVHISAEKCIRKIGKTYRCGGATKILHEHISLSHFNNGRICYLNDLVFPLKAISVTKVKVQLLNYPETFDHIKSYGPFSVLSQSSVRIVKTLVPLQSVEKMHIPESV